MKKILAVIIVLLMIATSINFTYAQTEVQVNPSGTEVIVSPNPAPVQQPTPKTTTPIPKIGNPLKAESVEGVILLAVDIAIYVGTAFAILAIIFVGFKFVEARGNEKKLEDAKKWFFGVIVGFAILISAKVIVEIIKNTLIQSGVVNESVWNPNK